MLPSPDRHWVRGAAYHSDVPQVVPDVSRLLLVFGQREGALERGQGHVVLLGIEAAEPQVVEKLAVIDPHLQESPLKRAHRFWVADRLYK